MSPIRPIFARSIFAGVALLTSLTLTGCGIGGGSQISASPADWNQYSGKTVTVRGNAGNSKQGPIVRFDDGGYIPLLTREPWTFDDRGRLLAGRPVEVTGRVVSGEGFRAEKYVLDPQTVTILPPESPDGKSSGK